MDCWYAHPNGRALDQQQGYGQQNMMPAVHMMPVHSGPIPHPITSPITSSFLPRSGDPGSPGNSSTSDSPKAGGHRPGASRTCKWGRKCHRPDCYFSHPEGRDMDAPKVKPKAVAAETKSDDDQFCPCCKGHPYECETEACAERGACGCTWGEDPTEDDDHSDDDTWKDEWFPHSRNCHCCKGYIYRCNVEQLLCESGTCFCHNESYNPYTNHQPQSEEVPPDEAPDAEVAESHPDEQ